MDFGVFIPILGIATGFLAVFGRVIVKPILQHQQQMSRSTDLQDLERKIAALESRLAGTEGTIDTLLEEREFMRKLAAGRTDSSTVERA
jgi:hypothetical protein